MPRSKKSPLQALSETPQLFNFDAGFRLLRSAAKARDGDNPVRFSTPATLAQPNAELNGVNPASEAGPAHLATGSIGLIGASGVMPRWYTELVAQSIRARSRGIADFLDMLAQRIIFAFARAGEKYRLNRSAEQATRSGAPEPIGEAVLALTGYGIGNMSERLEAGPDVLRFYAGTMSSFPRAADRLASMVSDFLGRQVEVVEFVGGWSAISPDQRSRLPRGRIPGNYNALSRDAAIGIRVWDQQARFVLRVGPLNRAEFEALLPDQARLAALVSLVRAYAGWEVDFGINLLVAVPEIPPLCLLGTAAPAPPRLGWTSWLPAAAGRRAGLAIAADAMFSASVVEGFGQI